MQISKEVACRIINNKTNYVVSAKYWIDVASKSDVITADKSFLDNWTISFSNDDKIFYVSCPNDNLMLTRMAKIQYI